MKSAAAGDAAARSASDKAQAEARARELTAAGELLTQGKHVAAIAAYQKILAENPDADTRMAAEFGLGKSYLGQDPEKAAERLQAFLERYDNADPKVVASARRRWPTPAMAGEFLSFGQTVRQGARRAHPHRPGQELGQSPGWQGVGSDRPDPFATGRSQASDRGVSTASPPPGHRLRARRGVLQAAGDRSDGHRCAGKVHRGQPCANGAVLAEAHFMLGTGYEGAGEHRKALKSFQRGQHQGRGGRSGRSGQGRHGPGLSSPGGDQEGGPRLSRFVERSGA